MKQLKFFNLLKCMSCCVVMLMGACEDSYTGNDAAKSTVVESYLFPGNRVGVKVHRILQFEGSDSAMQPIDTCQIDLFWKGKTFRLNSQGNGNYALTDSLLRLQSGDTVSIQLYVGEQRIYSTTTIPSKPSQFKASVTSVTMPDFSGGFNRDAFRNFEPIELTWSNPDESYYMIAVQPTDSTAKLVNPNDTLESTRRIRIFRNEPAITDIYRLEPFQFRYYGYNYVILYHLNPEYAALYKFSGNTSLSIKEPTSNLENALGIFTGINADTIKIYVY